MSSVLAFMLFYGLSIAVFTSLLLLSGLDPITAFSAVFASVNNTGPGLGPVGPMGNFAVLSDFQIWVCTFAMLIGRLELLTVLVRFTPIFWRKEAASPVRGTARISGLPSPRRVPVGIGLFL